MTEGPNIALIGSLIGDPARANMLTALMSGGALTASELAVEAGVTLQTASSHLAKLAHGGLVRPRRQGRHRYFSLTDDEVGAVLEGLMGLAAKRGHARLRPGPKDPALRRARVCYNHLAGERGVQMYTSLIAAGALVETAETGETAETVMLTDAGRAFVAAFGIALAESGRSRRPLCRPCLDWSARRNHLAGRLGTAFLQAIYDRNWARRRPDSRAVLFTDAGARAFDAAFPLAAA